MTTENNLELQAGNVKDATAGIKSSDLWQVPYEQLYILPGFNVREEDDAEYEAHVENLTKLMIANNYDRTKPMSGYVALIDGVSRVVVTDGHSRYKAAGRAIAAGTEIKTIPVVTATRGTSMEDLVVGLVTSNSGKPLKPYELGTVIKRLTGFGWEEDQIADKLNITKGYVQDLLLLHGATKALRDMVRTGKVAAGLAIAMLKKHGPKAVTVLQKALEGAKAEGKEKVSKKDIKGDFKSEVKKAAPKLYDVIASVKNDSAYMRLSKKTRDYIDEIIGELPEDPEAGEEG